MDGTSLVNFYNLIREIWNKGHKDIAISVEPDGDDIKLWVGPSGAYKTELKLPSREFCLFKQSDDSVNGVVFCELGNSGD